MVLGRATGVFGRQAGAPGQLSSTRAASRPRSYVISPTGFRPAYLPPALRLRKTLIFLSIFRHWPHRAFTHNAGVGSSSPPIATRFPSGIKALKETRRQAFLV